MKIGFLFAGQGSQYVGMGKDLYETYEEARQLIDHIQLDIDLKKVICYNRFSLNKRKIGVIL